MLSPEATTFGMMLRDIDCGANGVYFILRSVLHLLAVPPLNGRIFRFYDEPGGGQFVTANSCKECHHTAGLNVHKDFIVDDFELYIKEIGKYKIKYFDAFEYYTKFFLCLSFAKCNV